MDSKILINYTRAAETALRNIVTASMFNPVAQPKLDGNGLPFLSHFLRAEMDLLDHMELEPLTEVERNYILKFIGEMKKPESEGYCQWAANQIWLGLEEMKSRLTGKPSYKGYYLMHEYWGKYDETKIITKTNAGKYAAEYGLRSKQLSTTIDEWVNVENLHHHNAIDEIVKQFELIIPLLEASCPKAVGDAQVSMGRLKMKRNKNILPG